MTSGIVFTSNVLAENIETGSAPELVSENIVTTPISGILILILAGFAGFFFARKHQNIAKKHKGPIKQ